MRQELARVHRLTAGAERIGSVHVVQTSIFSVIAGCRRRQDTRRRCTRSWSTPREPAGSSARMDGSRGRRVGLVAKARGRVQLLQKEQEGAVVPLLAASIIKLLEDVTYRLDDRQLRQADLLGCRQHC